MKLIEINGMDGNTIFINPDQVLFVEDKSTFGETKSLIEMTHAMVYVPYKARIVYEMIREATEPNYCSYDKMMRLIEDERKYKEQLVERLTQNDN